MDPYRALAGQNRAAFERDPLFRPHADFAFERKEKLGAGGMGVVYRVTDLRFKREAALKVLFDARARPRKVDRFIREARVMAALDHPSIPAVYEYGRAANHELYILMKLVRGETLSQRIRAFHNFSSSREAERRAALFELLEALGQVCKALQYAHDKGVLHRDIKPDNIMIGRHGEVYLMDWGIARDLSESRESDLKFRAGLSGVDGSLFDQELTAERCVVGSFGYMAPEQARGGELDGRADVYALGAVLFELMADRPPISASGTAGRVAALEGRLDIPEDFGQGYPPELSELVMQCLSRERERRPKTPRAVARRLPRRGARPRKSAGKPIPFLVAALIAGAFAAVMLTLFLRERSIRRREEGAARQARSELEDLRRQSANRSNAPGTTPAAPAPDQEAPVKTNYTYNPRPKPRETAGAQYKDLIARYTGQINSQLNAADAHRNRGLVYLKLEEFRLALADFSRAIAMSGEDAEAFMNRGVARMKLGESQLALEDFNKAIALNPKYGQAFRNRGLLFLQQGRAPRAIEDQSAAIAIDPRDAEAYKNRAQSYLRQGKHELALADFNRALAIAPDAAAYINRAVAYAGLKRHKEAIADCDKGIELAPDNGGTYINRALSLEQLGRSREALQDLRRCLEVQPDIPTASAVREGIRRLERRLGAGS